MTITMVSDEKKMEMTKTGEFYLVFDDEGDLCDDAYIKKNKVGDWGGNVCFVMPTTHKVYV